MTEATATVTLTPAMMAEAFWKMDDGAQLEFFAELSRVIKSDGGMWLAEMQWHALAHELMRPLRGEPAGNLHASDNKANAARDVLMSMAAPLYLHTLRECDRRAGVL